MSETYPKPPLVEAVFEIFTGPGRWTSTSSDQIERSLRDRFDGPHDTFQAPPGIQIQLSAEGTAVSQTLPPEPLRQRMWTPSRGELFQFGPAMCAYNLLASYTHFDDHKGTVESLMRLYLEETQPEKLRWVGQRYVNKISVPISEDGPSQFFEVYPRIPSAEKQHRPFALQLLAGSFEGGQVTLSLAFQGEESATATYVLDLYARSTAEIRPSAEAVRQWHESAHVVIRRIFEASLTSRTKALFKGGEP